MTVLFDFFPRLRGKVPWLSLGVFPTPIEGVTGLLASGDVWLKRDDLSSPVYGGSKLRLLEHLLAEARDGQATRVYSSGAMGSNFALATALHAPRAGLSPGALCFPQPLTAEAAQSHRLVTARAQVVEVAHWSVLPLATGLLKRAEPRAIVLSQVTFDPTSLLGYLAAGLELAQQIADGACPLPARVILPIGSAATSSGLLAGLSLARKMGLLRGVPSVQPVRIAAWPLSRPSRILSLALQSLQRLADLSGDAQLKLGKSELLPLSVVTDQLGAGYPHGTTAGAAARIAFERVGRPILDDTYSAKAAAHLLAQSGPGPSLFWCTKSSAPLPEPSAPVPGERSVEAGGR